MTSFTDVTTWGRRGQAPPSPKLYYIGKVVNIRARGTEVPVPFGGMCEIRCKSGMKSTGALRPPATY